MLPRIYRMPARDVRFLFRQDFQKIHARHLSARVFFLPDPAGTPRFAVLLPKGSYKNSPDMHLRRRLVYTALAGALAHQKIAGRLLPAVLCGILPQDSFFALTADEREAAALAVLNSLLPND